MEVVMFKSAQTFDVDSSTKEAIRDLHQRFGVTTNAAVIRKCLALGRLADRYCGKSNVLRILDENDEIVRIDLRD